MNPRNLFAELKRRNVYKVAVAYAAVGWHYSPPRNCSHEALPFVEAAAKAKLAGSIETQPGAHLTALSAFRIVDIPIRSPRNKDVRSQRVLFGFH